MSRDERKALIKAIEEKRSSKVITYITSDRPNLATQIAGDVVSIIHDHIIALDEKERNKIDLFIYSRGGQSDVPWTLVSMFREYCKEGSFSVLIPYRAHSAATVIAMGADEIVMSKKAELGPIDITIGSGPYNPTEKNSNQRLPVSVEDVMGYFSLLEKIGCVRPEEKLHSFQQLANQVHPLVLGMVNRLLSQTELVALRLLNTRAKPYTEEKNKEIIRKLSSEIYSHQHTISRSEAIKELGLEQIVLSEKAKIANEIWDLYKHYYSLFELGTPFMPEEHLIANDLNEATWADLNLACIESIKMFDICQKSLKVRKLKKIPPQVTLNLGNISFPAMNIPALPAGITAQQLAQIVQQVVNTQLQAILNNAATNTVGEFLKALPSAGFEHISYNSGWKRSL